MRAKLGQEDRNAEPDRDSNHHRDDGGDDRAVDRRQRTILAGRRVPDVGDEKAEAESLKGGDRTVDQRCNDAAEEQQDDAG